MPVLVLAFNRPNLVKNLLATISPTNVSTLFISIDGPRNQSDVQKADEIIEIIHSYSKNVPILLRRGEVNLGCRLAVIAGLDWFFGETSGGLVLEDDCMPKEGLFKYIHANIYKVENNEVAMITAHNPFGQISFDDYKSRFVFITGWYMKSETWKEIRRGIFAIKPPYLFPKTKNPRKIKERIFWWAAYARARIGTHDTWDSLFYRAFSEKGYRCQVPKENLIENLGFGEEATHTKDPEGSILLSNGPNLSQNVFTSFELDEILADKYFKIRNHHAVIPMIKVVRDLITIKRLPDYESELVVSRAKYSEFKEII